MRGEGRRGVEEKEVRVAWRKSLSERESGHVA